MKRHFRFVGRATRRLNPFRNKNKRLWLVSGPTEMLTCRLVHQALFSAEPAEDILVHYGRAISVPPRLRRETLSHGHSAGAFWRRIVDLCDVSEAITQMTASQELEAIRTILSIFGTEITHIVTHTIDLLFERLLFRAYPTASIVFYDNGLVSYLEKAVIENSSAWSPPGSVWRGDLDRLSTAFLTFQGRLPVPNFLSACDVRSFDRTHVLQTLSKMAADFPATELLQVPQHTPVHMVLATAFYRTNLISYEDERLIHQRYIDAMLSDAGAVVLFKEHPRANDRPFIQSNERLRVLGTTLPVEIVPLMIKLHSAASISSTALLYLDWLYGIPMRLLPTPRRFACS